MKAIKMLHYNYLIKQMRLLMINFFIKDLIIIKEVHLQVNNNKENKNMMQHFNLAQIKNNNNKILENLVYKINK